MDLKNKVVVVTGASDGIGKEIALKLASSGCSLALLGRDVARLNSVADKCTGFGATGVKTYAFDIRSHAETKDFVENLRKDFEGISVLINNAGVWHLPQPLENIGEEKAMEVLETNLSGLIRLTALVMPTLKKQKSAAIINISSRSGKIAPEGQSVYAASKWGVTGFTEVLKVDLKGTGVRVAGVYQGKTRTDIFKKADDPRDTSNGIDPKDLAEVIVFMLTRPEHTWIHDINIEG